MAKISNLFKPNRPFHVDTSVHYDTFCFSNRGDLDRFCNEVTQGIPADQSKSQWYGNITQSVTILQVPQVIREMLRMRESFNPSPTAHSVVAVLPATLKYPNKLIGVFDEYKLSFGDIQECLQYQPQLFQPAHTIFLSVRLSQMSNQKIRNLFLAELFSTVVRTVRRYFVDVPDVDHSSSGSGGSSDGGGDGDSEAAIINLVMHYKDADQSGLYKMFKSYAKNDHLDFQQQFVQLFIPFPELVAFAQRLQHIDAIVIDLVITANDLKLLGERTDQLDITALPTTVSRTRSVDAGLLKQALVAADSCPETVSLHKLETATRHLVALLNVAGLSFEAPVKFLSTEVDAVHLYKQCKCIMPSADGNQPKTAALKPSMQETFVMFRRTVRDVDETGYKVKLVSVYFWVVILLSVGVSTVYAAVRRKEVQIEDLIQAVSSLVTLLVGATTTLILNTKYKGEALFDVLTNLRKIDTQDEFDGRRGKQVADTIEVLRLSKRCPQFLGGGPNASFIRNILPNSGLQAKTPMAFANLQNIGYGLFECQSDWLFMIDPWNNVFKVSIINHRESLPKFRDRPKNNAYRADCMPILPGESPSNSREEPDSSDVMIPLGNDSLSVDPYATNTEEDVVQFMTLLCTPLEVKGKVDRFNLEVTDETDRNFRCIVVQEKNNDVTKYLSRVLPYGMKYRTVGVMGRYARLDVTWKLIRNRDIHRMDVGIPSM